MKNIDSPLDVVLRLAGFLCLSALFWGSNCLTLHAQPVITARNVALGNGGTAYVSGLESTFWNPANLMISDIPGRFHIGAGQIGVLYDPVLSSGSPGTQYYRFSDIFQPYNSGMATIAAAERAAILNDNYQGQKLLSRHQGRTDVILAGVHWQNPDEAFSIVARSRMASRIDVGRGWYSFDFIASDGRQIRDFTLHQQRSQFWELSAGYAREFTFVNGLVPRMSKLYIGIAPKMILAGPHFDAAYDGKFSGISNNETHPYIHEFRLRTTGSFTRITRDYLASSDPQQAINRNINRKLDFQPSGYGFGFDFGLTYLIPLGNDLYTLQNDPAESTARKSLRIAFSINDIGLVRYTRNAFTLSSPRDTVQIEQPTPHQSRFIGADGQYMSYLHTANTVPNPLLNAGITGSDDYSVLLPSSLNAGLLFELAQLKLMSDLTLGLNNTAFTDTKLAAHLGLEVLPIPQIPVRAGTRFATGLPTRVGFGAGYKSKHWELNAGAQVLLKSRTLTSELVGGAFAGIQLHL